MFFEEETPHGLLCFIIALVGSLNSFIQLIAESISSILL